MPRTSTEWVSTERRGAHAHLLNKADRRHWLLAIFDTDQHRLLMAALDDQDLQDLHDFIRVELGL